MMVVSGVTLGLVEDSEEDFRAFERVIDRDGSGARVQRWGDAEAVIAALQSPRNHAHWPSILVIDLNLPGIDGCELVRRVRAIPATQAMPLFVLSGSDSQHDIDRCYAAGANAYLTKPTTAAELRALLQMVLASLVVFKAPTPPRQAQDQAWEVIEDNREAYERALRSERQAREQAEELQRLTGRLATRLTRAEVIRSLADELRLAGRARSVMLVEPGEMTPRAQISVSPSPDGRLALIPVQASAGGTRRTLKIQIGDDLDAAGHDYFEQVGTITGNALDRVARLGAARRRGGGASDLPNERWWAAALNEQIRTSAAAGQALSIVVVELAGFARYLASHGPVAGDLRLLTVIDAWRRAEHDLFSPYGDEQFVAIMPGCTALEAHEIADEIAHGPGLLGLFTAGAAQWRHGDSDQHLMARAEQALRGRS